MITKSDRHTSKTDRSHRPEIVQAEPLTVEGTIPAWLKGAYYVAGPHLQQIGSTRVQHFLDGLGMVYKFDLSPVSQTATWQTRWIRSEIYNRSMALGHEAAAPQFMETVPPRNYSAVRNVLFGVNDNTYVAMKPAADGCSMLGTTDDTYVTRFSADLQSFTRLSWTDKLVPKLHQALQVAHPVVNSSTGGMTGLLIVSPELPLGKPFAAVFRVSPEEEQRRVLVGQRIPLSQAPYMHSFGLSDRHAVICEHGWRIDSEALLSGKMFEGAAVVDDKMPTRFHVLELASGELTTHTSSDAFLCLHFANVHHNGSALVFDMPTWQTAAGSSAPCMPYAVFDASLADDKQQRDSFNQRCSSKLVRHTIPLASNVESVAATHSSTEHDAPLSAASPAANASFEVLDDGWYEYPTFNEEWRGRRSCFIYLTTWYADGHTNGAMALTKYDTCRRVRAASYSRPSLFPSEPHFVGRPGAMSEDDGVLITTMLDGLDRAKAAHVAVLDARTLHVLARLPLNETVPGTVHGWFRFAADHDHSV